MEVNRVCYWCKKPRRKIELDGLCRSCRQRHTAAGELSAFTKNYLEKIKVRGPVMYERD